MHYKNRIKTLISSTVIILTLIISSYTTFAQVYDSEQNPPSLRWHQINTPNFQIIFPEAFHKEAQRVAAVLETVLPKESETINKRPHKISIILQNQGTTSNGFVQLGPRRSEFYTTPPQSFDYQDWLNSLAVHEMRHVVQFDKLTGNLRAPFFEKLALAVFGVTLPPWFYEGDAVGTETALSGAGRGRIPEWFITFRTNTLSDRKYSYSKDFFSSYRDLTPGYYQLGFFMNAKLRRDYGKGVTDSILSRIARLPFRPYPFSSAVKKITGMNTRRLHDSTVAELDKLWSDQVSKTDTQNYVPLNRRKDNTPAHYLLPVATSEGHILALKQSYARTPAIVRIDPSGKEQKIVNIGLQETAWFSYSAGKIVWDESRFDPRFHQRSFNVINIFDTRTGRARQLTHRSRLFAPALSPDGQTILAVAVTYSNEIFLVELDARNGRELKRYASPGNRMLQMPAFSGDGSKAVVVAVEQTGKSLYELDRSAGTFNQLMPVQAQEILRPVYSPEGILFKAHFNGIDNIYALKTETGEIRQLTSAKFGAFNPSYDTISSRLIFNSYSKKGNDIATLNASNFKNLTLPAIRNTFVDYAQLLAGQEGKGNIFDSVRTKTYPTSRYRELSNLFYFHSIVPIAEDNANFDDYNLGLELQSDNKLNTMSSYLRYQYNNALRKSEYLAGFAYKRFYPIISIDYSNQARLIYRRLASNGKILYSPVTWRENEMAANVTVPFTLNRFNNNYSFGLKAGTSYTSRYDVQNGMPSLIRTLDFPMHYQFYASRNNRRASRDLAPRWGQNIILSYWNFPFENQVKGELFTFRSTFYFPGLLNNHSFQASFNYREGNGNYVNTINIPRVSGYSFLRPTGNTRNTLLLDYRMPLFYPDLEVGPLAYIKRFKGGLFTDFEDIGKGNSFSPRSFGAELRADMNLMRFYLPNFDLGGRIIFLNEKPRKNPIFEFMGTYNF
ncbi:TolB family protein [Arcticibacter sp. MXS-1]|uniref:TolB family protein n=1 Tax=Arcticibacter sp. MXS-1 TaxID=3341726 RepID=UPI0035A8A0A1